MKRGQRQQEGEGGAAQHEAQPAPVSAEDGAAREGDIEGDGQDLERRVAAEPDRQHGARREETRPPVRDTEHEDERGPQRRQGVARQDRQSARLT
jgi:hypothetical protein